MNDYDNLDQAILNCWQVLDDLVLVKDTLLADEPTYAGAVALKQIDSIRTLYESKFNKMYQAAETLFQELRKLKSQDDGCCGGCGGCSSRGEPLEVNTTGISASNYTEGVDAIWPFPSAQPTVDNLTIVRADEHSPMFLLDSTQQEVRKALHNGIVFVKFIKSDNTEREMNCTLREYHIPEEKQVKGVKRNQPADSIAVFDVEKNDWRSFRWDSVREMKWSY